MKKYCALFLLSFSGLVYAMCCSGESINAKPQTYQLEISFSGADIRLEIKDNAKWAPSGALIAVTNAAGNATTYNVSIQQPYVHLSSQDHKTSVTAYLTISVETDAEDISLDVQSDNFVLVKCLQSNQSFVVKKGEGGLRKLRLK